MNNKFSYIAIPEKLAERKNLGTFRTLQVIEARYNQIIKIGGKEYVNFSSNDYLGMALNPELSSAWQEGFKLYGSGSGASPLVTGHTAIHEELSCKLASLLNKEKVILFNSGFAANQAIIKTFAVKGSAIYMDKLAHASLQEAAVLSGAVLNRFRHNDPASLRRYLEKNKNCYGGLIVTEGVFSMDGDEAPLQEISSLSEEFQIPLVLDDAHGFGIHGKQGLGTISKQGLDFAKADIIMGTFGKAFGTAGAFIASSSEVIDYMINFTREYIYSTYMPPATAYATLFAINYVRAHDELRHNLNENVDLFRRGFKDLGFALPNSTTSIQPVIIGSSEKTLAYSKMLKDEGLYVGAIRPPTVPQGTARLRITITAAHTREQIIKLLDGLKKCQNLIG